MVGDSVMDKMLRNRVNREASICYDFYIGAYPGFSEGGGRDPPNKITSQTCVSLGLSV